MDGFFVLRYSVVFILIMGAARCNVELKSLLIFKNQYISSYSSDVLSDWDPRSPNPCNWTGISCSSKGHVVKIWLWDKGLTGTIAPHLGNLTFLRVLNLSKNEFEGTIPSSLLQRLPSMENISLGGNKLTGKIPSFNQNCSNLSALDLSFNNLSGIVPRSLLNCTALEALDLSCNYKISGIIPKEIGRSFPKMWNLTLDSNMLVGGIPESLGNLSQLLELGLSGNYLTGSLPWDLLKCRKLIILKVNNNNLSGQIPHHIGNALPNLRHLNMYNNNISGVIPASLGNSSQLRKLKLSTNRLVGIIPHSLLNCTKLEDFGISNNRISGTIPPKIGLLLRNMQILKLSRNNLEGRIPDSIGNMSHLKHLDAANNKLQGIIPVSLRQLSKLESLNLDRNQLQSGVRTAEQQIPILDALSNSSVLACLTLEGNNLVGALPANFGSVSLSHHLQELILANNSIGGNIPSIIGNFSVLQNLYLRWNCFIGPIPASLGALKSLQTLDISHNNLSGKIPQELGSMTKFLINLHLSDNRLCGPIPGSIGDIASLEDLSLSRNQLSGPIPPELWKLRNIQKVDLSFNNLSGILPISVFPSLEMMNLSHNMLKGNVPKWVYSISHMNLSYNDLQGDCSGESSNSFLGNPRLTQGCSNSSNVPSNTKSSDRKTTLLACILGSSAVLLVFGLIIILYVRKYREEETLLGPQQFLNVSEEEIMQATDNFSAQNFLGEGNFGRVFKGILSDGAAVAVKLFSAKADIDDEDPADAERSFIRECKTLGQIRHRNLVRIITTCCSERFRAIVLPFMSNGSLHDLLHLPRKEEARLMPLSLRSRLRILTEIANALSYLHHDCSPPIIHCDLKPHNVLLDEEMTAHLSDFGMARFLGMATATSNLQGSIGYIAPEYGVGTQAWSRGDVYSFGVIVLEVLTRIEPTDPLLEGGTLCLWVSKALTGGKEHCKELMINGRDGQKELEKLKEEEWPLLEGMLKVGVWCCSDKPERRPTMRDVEAMFAELSREEASDAGQTLYEVVDRLNAVVPHKMFDRQDTSDRRALFE